MKKKESKESIQDDDQSEVRFLSLPLSTTIDLGFATEVTVLVKASVFFVNRICFIDCLCWFRLFF